MLVPNPPVPGPSVTYPDHDPPVERLSPEADRERLLAEALAQASAKDEAFRRPGSGPHRTGWKMLLALVLLAAAAVLAVSPPSWLSPSPLPVLRHADVARGTLAVLDLEARQIDAFRLTHGHLPYSLDELPRPMPGVTFVRSNDRVYQLVAVLDDGSRVVYDSADPAPDFRAVAAAWTESRRR